MLQQISILNQRLCLLKLTQLNKEIEGEEKYAFIKKQHAAGKFVEVRFFLYDNMHRGAVAKKLETPGWLNYIKQ